MWESRKTQLWTGVVYAVMLLAALWWAGDLWRWYVAIHRWWWCG